MLALLCFCVATEFSVNKDLYKIQRAIFDVLFCLVFSSNVLLETTSKTNSLLCLAEFVPLPRRQFLSCL